MRGIFFDEKLGETQRNSEGVQAARAEMEGVIAVGGVGAVGAVGAARARMGAIGVVRIAPDSLTRQLPTTPKGKRGGKGRLRVGGLRIKNNFY